MESIGLRTKLLGDLKLLEIEKRYKTIYVQNQNVQALKFLTQLNQTLHSKRMNFANNSKRMNFAGKKWTRSQQRKLKKNYQHLEVANFKHTQYIILISLGQRVTNTNSSLVIIQYNRRNFTTFYDCLDHVCNLRRNSVLSHF